VSGYVCVISVCGSILLSVLMPQNCSMLTRYLSSDCKLVLSGLKAAKAPLSFGFDNLTTLLRHTRLYGRIYALF